MTKIRPLRLLVCCVLFFSMWEVCARVDDYLEEGAPILGNYGISAMLTHDDVGVVGIPNGQYGKWKMNALGYRGPNIHSNTLKIICVGASETFGMFESLGNEYPRQLERTINARHPDEHVEVVNVAYAGQSLYAFSHRVDKIVDTISPNIAILYPSFLVYFDSALLRKPDSWDWVQTPQGFHSRIVGKLLPLIDKMPKWAEDMRYRFHIWRAVRSPADVKDAIPEANVDQFRADLDATLDALQRRHVCPVLITHATFFGRTVEPDERFMLTAWRRFTPNLADDGFLDAERRFNAVVRQEAQQRQLPLVEAADVLSGPENFADWVHFTNLGANKMAHLISDKLSASALGSSSQWQQLGNCPLGIETSRQEVADEAQTHWDGSAGQAK